jgi:hypothetical protein
MPSSLIPTAGQNRNGSVKSTVIPSVAVGSWPLESGAPSENPRNRMRNDEKYVERAAFVSHWPHTTKRTSGSFLGLKTRDSRLEFSSENRSQVVGSRTMIRSTQVTRQTAAAGAARLATRRFLLFSSDCPFWPATTGQRPHVGQSGDKRRSCIHPSSMTTVPFYPFPPRLPFPLSAPLSLFTCLPVLVAVNLVRLETNAFSRTQFNTLLLLSSSDISCLYWSIAIFGLFSSDCSQSPPDSSDSDSHPCDLDSIHHHDNFDYSNRRPPLPLTKYFQSESRNSNNHSSKCSHRPTVWQRRVTDVHLLVGRCPTKRENNTCAPLTVETGNCGRNTWLNPPSSGHTPLIRFHVPGPVRHRLRPPDQHGPLR